MKRKSFFSVSLALVLAVSVVLPAAALFVPSDGQPATLVLGEPNFTTDNATPDTLTGLFNPYAVAVDPTSGKVFVADTGDNRVLRFADVLALSNGAAPDGVLGEPNFTTGSANARATRAGMSGPMALALDAGGRLWVADTANNRVLRFDHAAVKANGANADAVLGQPNFTGHTAHVTRTGMSGPRGLAVDAAGRLWVSDAFNNRVLRFDTAAAKANGANADGVLGQPNYTGNTPHTTRNGLGNPSLPGDPGPTGLIVDSTGRLWVADSFNNRVLRFDLAAARPNGANASGVLGQLNFASNTAQTTQNGIFVPMGVAVDKSGRLYVAEYGNNRILSFDHAATLANGANATNVLGQLNFTASALNTGGVTAGSLQPGLLFYDPAAQVLWAADHFNDRVLMYGQPYANIGVLRYIGLVHRYLPPGVIQVGSLSIQTAAGQSYTFEVTRGTTIQQVIGAAPLGVGSDVSVFARQDPYTLRNIAVKIVVHVP